MARPALVLVVLAAACASAAPAPIDYGSSGDGAQYSPAPPHNAQTGRPVPRPATTHESAEGGSTALSAYALRPEDVQPFDPARRPRSHRVGRNETLYDIATRYQIPVLVLIDHNRLEPPYALTPGRVLDLPPPRFHVVGRGESFEEVARRYYVDTRSLALLNRMQPPYIVREGDRIVLPAVPGEAGRTSADPDDERRDAASIAPTPPLGGTARFSMPLDGDIVTRFGAQPGGGRVDGLEIAGREGAGIRAAADGEIVYAGSDLESYGTLVLVRHADNYVTAYGYARRALVREGQRVRTGEEIAEVGLKGERPLLLFQVRQGSAAIDPLPLLGRSN